MFPNSTQFLYEIQIGRSRKRTEKAARRTSSSPAKTKRGAVGREEETT